MKGSILCIVKGNFGFLELLTMKNSKELKLLQEKAKLVGYPPNSVLLPNVFGYKLFTKPPSFD